MSEDRKENLESFGNITHESHIKRYAFWNWFAGFWEGEGSLFIHPTGVGRGVSISIAQKDETALRYIENMIGGNIHSKGKNCSQWSTGATLQVKKIAEKMLPFMVSRKEEVKSKLNKINDFVYKDSERMRWTEEQDDIIKKNWKHLSDSELATRIKMETDHHRTRSQVRARRSRLGLRKRNPGKKWTQNEIEFLKKNYKNMPYEELTNRFPNRSYHAVKSKIASLRESEDIDYKKEPWSEEEIEFLKENWNENSRWLAKKLNRSSSRIRTKRTKMGLKKQSKGVEWTDEETKYLLNNYSDETAKEIANEIGRTKSAVYKRAQVLGVT